MYFFKPNPLLNQQKKRKITKTINKYNFITNSIFFKKKQIFFLNNKQSIDLRFYKFLLRKFKKKFIKKHIKVNIFLFPNKKISNKSKNSRMGKGKGLFNRFYFCQNKIKPILVFENINLLKFIKIKKNLMKFLKFKLFKCLN